MRTLRVPAPPLLSMLCLALLLPACAGGGGDPGEEEELAAILRLEDRRESPALLAPFLEHRSERVRARAARAAGRLGRSEAVALLEAALGDQSPAVRGEAAFALGLVDESPEARRVAARALLPALLDSEAQVRAPAVRALCRQAGALALAGEDVEEEEWAEEAAALLQDSEREVLQEALLGLWLFPAPVALERVAGLVGSEDPRIRWAAAYHLSRRLRSGQRVGATPVPTGLPLDEEGRRLAGSRLLAAGEDPEEEVRREAARGLGHVPGEESLRALAALVGDSSWRVRVEALRGLAAHPELSADLLLPGLSDPSPHVRSAALGAAAALGPAAAPVRLQAAVVDLLTDPSEEVRIAAHPAAAALLPRGTYDTLTADPDLLRRGGAGAGDATAAAVLGGRVAALGLVAVLASQALPQGGPGEEGAEGLIEAALEQDGLLRDPELSPLAGAAARQLLWEALVREVAPDSGSERRGRVLEALPALLPSPSLGLPARAAAFEGLATLLGSLPQEERVGLRVGLGEALERAYREALGDELMDARRGALEGLALLGGEPARGALVGAADSEPSPWLRRRASELARGLGAEVAPAPYDTAREIADYRALLSLAAGPLEARFETGKGTFVAELLGGEAPLTVASFRELARSGHFDGQRFHRVVPDFVVQGGDPRGDGYGGPGFELRCEINPEPYGRGTLGMALSGKDTGGSQFFVTHAPQPHLDGRYTVFGRVVSGQEVVDRLTQGDRLLRVIVD